MDQPVKSTHKEMFLEITNYCMNSVNKKQLMRLIILQNSVCTYFTYPRKHSSSNGPHLLVSRMDACKKHGKHKRGIVKKHLTDTKLKRSQKKELNHCTKVFTFERTVLHHSLSCNPKLNVDKDISQ